MNRRLRSLLDDCLPTTFFKKTLNRKSSKEQLQISKQFERSLLLFPSFRSYFLEDLWYIDFSIAFLAIRSISANPARSPRCLLDRWRNI
jgi:hypothetical protein